MAWPPSSGGGGGGGSGVVWGTPTSTNIDTKVFTTGGGDFEEIALVLSTKPVLLMGIGIAQIGGSEITPSPQVYFYQDNTYKDDTYSAPVFSSIFSVPYTGIFSYWCQDGTAYIKVAEGSFNFDKTTQYNLVVDYITLE